MMAAAMIGPGHGTVEARRKPLPGRSGKLIPKKSRRSKRPKFGLRLKESDPLEMAADGANPRSVQPPSHSATPPDPSSNPQGDCALGYEPTGNRWRGPPPASGPALVSAPGVPG